MRHTLSVAKLGGRLVRCNADYCFGFGGAFDGLFISRGIRDIGEQQIVKNLDCSSKMKAVVYLRQVAYLYTATHKAAPSSHDAGQAHIKGAVLEAKQRTRSIKQGGDDTLPHVESFIGRVLNSVHEHVVLLRVSMEIHVEQHLVRARGVGGRAIDSWFDLTPRPAYQRIAFTLGKPCKPKRVAGIKQNLSTNPTTRRHKKTNTILVMAFLVMAF